MNSKIAAVLRAFSDDDLAPLRAHVDIRALSDDSIAGLVKHLEGEPRARVMTALGESLVGEAAPVATPVAPKAKKTATPKPVKEAARAPGQKRSPEEMAALQGRVLATVEASAEGIGMESLGKALGVETKDLSLPLKKLIAEKKVVSKGHKRATRYFSKKK